MLFMYNGEIDKFVCMFSGRILNRFSKDMGSLDELLPKALLDTVQSFTVIGGIIIMGLIVNAWMLIPTLFLGIVFYKIRTYYIHSAQDIKRLEGISKLTQIKIKTLVVEFE